MLLLLNYNDFHISGNAPIQGESLNITARGTQISSAASFSIFAGILSRPGDFDSYSPFSAVNTQCFVTDLNLNLADLSITGRY